MAVDGGGVDMIYVLEIPEDGAPFGWVTDGKMTFKRVIKNKFPHKFTKRMVFDDAFDILGEGLRGLYLFENSMYLRDRIAVLKENALSIRIFGIFDEVYHLENLLNGGGKYTNS